MTTQAVLFPSGAPNEMQTNDPLAYLSPSRLKSFLTCRLKFYYEKVLGRRPPASPNLQIGKAVHEGLEVLHLAQMRGEAVTPDQVLEDYQLAYHVLEAQESVAYNGKDRQACIDTGARVLRAYLGSDLAHDPRRILGVEVYL
ncbi:MAG: PD-(D/E)XK nuclease family protein, partial [Gammaproteobacteria bacterium]